TDADSDYSPTVWKYLNATPPGSNHGLSRRVRLTNTWLQLGRLNQLNQPSLRRNLEQLASANPKHQVVTIDVLANRSAMLSDLSAVVAQIDALLLELMQYVCWQR
ncbi:MAG: hypothetical protein HY711_11280, partial [Candidatus Melainabacteria bacterium]|nr:hypothetical protein [Candidatus Melainabacteria bacterium]